MCCCFVDGVVVVSLSLVAVFLLRIFLSLEERALLFCVSSSFVVYFFIYSASFIVAVAVVAVVFHTKSHSPLLYDPEAIRCCAHKMNWLFVFFSFLSLSHTLSFTLLTCFAPLLLLYFSSENDTTGAIVRNIIMQFY